MRHPLKTIASKPLAEEMNYLFWMDPFVNEGIPDFGWSCREHAWAAALVLRSWGHFSEIYKGEAVFLPRAAPKSARMQIHQQTHSWVHLGDGGFVDLSPKPTGRFAVNNLSVEYGNPFPLGRVYEKRFVVRGKNRVAHEFQPGDFQSTVDRLYRVRDTTSVVYHGVECDTLIPEILDACTYINSPLTDILKEKYDESIYIKALRHLLCFADGETESLTSIDRSDAWDAIFALPDDSLEVVARRTRL